MFSSLLMMSRAGADMEDDIGAVKAKRDIMIVTLYVLVLLRRRCVVRSGLTLHFLRRGQFLGFSGSEGESHVTCVCD